MMQETRIKSLETEILRAKKEKEAAELQKRYGEERYGKLKSQFEVQTKKEVDFKKQVTDKDKAVNKLQKGIHRAQVDTVRALNERIAIWIQRTATFSLTAKARPLMTPSTERRTAPLRWRPVRRSSGGR